MRVSHIEGVTDQQLVSLFSAARAEDYQQIEAQTNEVKQAISCGESDDISDVREQLARLRRHYTEVMRIDYFNSPEGKRIGLFLQEVEKAISPTEPEPESDIKMSIDEYREKIWVTRPHPHVDRLSCAWLIRKYINPQAVIRYSNTINPGEVTFDMDEAEFGHRGNLCTFETMRQAFGLNDGGLRPIAEIIHEIDLHDDRYTWPETPGIETLLNGWCQSDMTDKELELRGITLFEGLYAAFSRTF
jgi:hypothetical protein